MADEATRMAMAWLSFIVLLPTHRLDTILHRMAIIARVYDWLGVGLFQIGTTERVFPSGAPTAAAILIGEGTAAGSVVEGLIGGLGGWVDEADGIPGDPDLSGPIGIDCEVSHKGKRWPGPDFPDQLRPLSSE